MDDKIEFKFELREDYDPQRVDEQVMAGIKRIEEIRHLRPNEIFDPYCVQFLLISYGLMAGKVSFKVNNIEFGECDGAFSVLLYAMNLLNSVLNCVMLYEKTQYDFEGNGLKVVFEQQGTKTLLRYALRNKNFTQPNKKQFRQTSVDSLYLLNMVGQFYKDVIDDCFYRHPKISNSEPFKHNLPLTTYLKLCTPEQPKKWHNS